MKTDINTMKEIERLFMGYEKEVMGLGKDGILEENTVRTYLGYADKFVRWCNDKFEPGIIKKSKIRK